MEFKKIKLPFQMKKATLALGGHTKNTICFAQADTAYLSPVHADLSAPQDFLDFQKDVRYFLRKAPKLIACDLHPGYQSTRYAYRLQTTDQRLQTTDQRPQTKERRIVAVQHHHAHIAACMAENGLRNQKVIGVAWDGTGLGSDNKLWGAEFLVCDYKNYARRAHLREIPLIGSERAIQEPWRQAAYWLFLIYGRGFLQLKLDFTRRLNQKKWQVLQKMLGADFNLSLSSSMGRLFDAAASLIFANFRLTKEAELARNLEEIALSCKPSATNYDFKITRNKQIFVLEPQIIFRQIVKDLINKVPKRKIAYRFHLTAAEILRRTCLLLSKETRLRQVVLSGGVFQNNLLLRLGLTLLQQEGFRCFWHRQLSSSDATLSLGQAAVANFSGQQKK